VYLRQLTGDTSCTIDQNIYTLTTRSAISKSMNYLAAKYIKFRLQSYGLTVTEQPFTFNGYEAKNIYAVQTGSLYPNEKLIICAHFDNVAEGRGADDNGTGTVAVLEAARIISKLHPSYTIIYALWSAEEQGLYGSAYYAAQALSGGENIKGVINLDMIGWDNNNPNNLAIYDVLTTTQFMTDKLSSVNSYYGIALTLSKYSQIETRSDNYPFIYRGYPAICLIETDWAGNINYHNSNDVYANVNLTFFNKVVKLAVGTLAELTGVGSMTPVENSTQVPSEFALYQNYPNPFNPGTVIAYDLKTAGYVNLKVFDMLGREVKTLVDGYKPAGKQQVSFTAEGNLASGVYIYSLQAGSLLQIRKMVYNK
jgi:hypothetical protein